MIKKKITRQVYKIYLSRNELYEIVTQVDKKYADIIMEQADKQEVNKEIGNEKEYYKRYYQQNKAAIRKKQKKYRLLNREKIIKYQKEYSKKWRQTQKRKKGAYVIC